MRNIMAIDYRDHEAGFTLLEIIVVVIIVIILASMIVVFGSK